MSGSTGTPTRAHRIVVLVGTDHHPFDRAVVWADARQRSHAEDEVVVQYGQSPAPTQAGGSAFYSSEDLHELISSATVVIVHGGPGTINDARAGGHRPIVLPRDPAFGEHVDDHQMRFAAWSAERDLVRLADDLDHLDTLVAELGEQGTREDVATDTVPAGVATLAALVETPRRPSRPVAPGSPVVFCVAATTRPEVATELEEAFLGIPGALLMGAVATLPERLADPASECACGKAVEDCSFWSEVLDRVDGRVDTDAFPGLREGLRRRLAPERRSELLARSLVVRRLLAAAAEVSGARCLVDVSDLSGVLALSHEAGLDLRVVSPGGQGAARPWKVAAARRRRLPVLALSGHAGAEVVVRRLASVPLPPVGPALADHGADVRVHER